MSRKANCWDNAVAECFFKSLKVEMIYGKLILSTKQMKAKVFEYLEMYTKKRRHSSLNYQTINEFNQTININKAA
ncbi:IS3 family transposase [Myroides odoratus]|uniref:IS3 family transposase n=1 Tax=Myroides odoratus TaxID=256 RepID=UPI0039AF4C88